MKTETMPLIINDEEYSTMFNIMSLEKQLSNYVDSSTYLEDS